MSKVPVGRTIGHAYGFLAVRFDAVLGLGWLPAVFYAGAAWFCLRRMGAVMAVAPPSSAAFNQFTALDFLALLVATALLVPTVAVPFTQTALGLPRERAAAHFVFGGRELRMFLALLRFYAIVIVTLAALAFLCQFAIGIGLPEPGTGRAGFAMPANLYGAPISLWLNGTAIFVLAIAFLFLTVRFGFFLPAAAAAEQHVSLRRAWALSRGNFWRIAVAYVAVALPAAALLGIAVYAVEGAGLADVLRTAWAGIPSEGMGALYRLQYDHAGALAAIGAVSLVVMNALSAGASAAAYQAVAATADVPEVAQERAEPEFAPAWAPAMASPSRRWQHDSFETANAARVEHVEPLQQEQFVATEPVAEHVPHSEPVAMEANAAQPEMLAEESAQFAQQPVSEMHADPAAEALHEAASEPVVAEPEAAPQDMAPPLDPAGAMAMRDQINPPAAG